MPRNSHDVARHVCTSTSSCTSGSTVHVVTAAKAENGWLMRLKVTGPSGDLEVIVRVPEELDESAAIARVMQAVCARLRGGVRSRDCASSAVA